ncbi:MAG: glycosyltransferase family 2 protein [Alsobacter sp.]
MLSYRGKLERLEGRILHGWIWKVDELSPAVACVHINDQFVGEVNAGRRRDDLIRKNIGSGAHGFRFIVPASYCDGQQHRFTLFGKESPKNPISSLLSEVEARDSQIEGRVETILRDKIIGWAYDNLNPHASVTLFLNDPLGNTIASIVANLQRRDLLQRGIGTGSHGFSIAVPPQVSRDLSGMPLTIIARGAGSEQTILGTCVLPALSAIASVQSTRPDLSSRQPSVDDHADEPWAKKLRALPLDQLYLHSRNKSDAAACQCSQEAHGLRIVSSKPTGWLRILKICSLPEANVEFDALRISITALAQEECSFSVSLMICDSEGVFKAVHRFGRDRKFKKGDNHLTFKLKGQKAISDLRTGGTPYAFLCLETHHSFDVTEPSFEIEYLSRSEETPYRSSSLHVHQRLATLNDNFAHEGKSDVHRLVLESAEIAVRLECYQTASALLEKVTISDFRDDSDQQRFLAVASDILLAEGRLDELRALLLEQLAVVQNSDLLISALTACIPATDRFSELLAILPSGKLNRYFLSRVGLHGAGLKSLLLKQDGYTDGQSELLLASMIRETSEAAYIKGLSGYLSRFNLAGVRSINWAMGNALAGLEFNSDCVRVPPKDVGTVSVIMSAYNAAETINYSIRSILDQTYQNMELLVCDDGSTDGTIDVIKTITDPRLRVFRSVGNQGPYNVRNFLLKEARGAYLTFQDSDDLAHPMRLERQLDAMFGAQAKACTGKWLRVRPSGDIAFFRDQICLRPSVVSILAERDVFNLLGPYRQSVCGADSELYERIRIQSAVVPFVEVDAPLILGLWSPQSLTQQPGMEATEDGYRSTARRAYAEVGARQRLLGSQIVSDNAVAEILSRHGIARAPKGVQGQPSSSRVEIF